MEWIDDWDKIRKRFEAFWEGNVLDRCMIAVFAPKDGVREIDSMKAEEENLSKEELLRRWTDAEYVVDRKLKEFNRTFFGGDAFPQIWLNLGASGHAGYFRGSKYGFAPDTVWFESIIDDPDSFKLYFDKETFLYRKTLELAEILTSESKGRYFVSMPDTAGNLDALAHLRSTENLLVDLITRPHWVKDSLEKIQTAWRTSLDQIYNIVQENNDGGCTIGWLNTWAPKKHAQLQSDISLMLSPDMFEEFVMPELDEQCSVLDHPLYHLDGFEQIRHLPQLLSLKELQAIQWTTVAGQPSPVEFLDSFKRIQESGKSLLIPFHNNFSIRDLEMLMRELSSKGLLILVNADSESEALEIVQLVEKLTHD
jgi:hypothetical protein